MPPSTDPREIITPSSFAIAPELLGQPLARPWRRLAAFLVDLLLIGILVGLLEAPSVFFGAILALFLFRITRPKGRGSARGRTARGTLRLAAAMIAFAVAVALWDSTADALRGGDDDGAPRGAWTRRTAPDGGTILSAEGSLASMGIALSDIIALATVSNEEEAQAAATRVRERLVAAGITAEEAQEIRESIEEGKDPQQLGPLGIQAVIQALHEIERSARDSLAATPVAPPSVDSLALDLGASMRRGDGARAEALRAQLAGILAHDTLEVLERHNRRLESEARDLRRTVDRLEDEREEAGRGISIVRFVRTTLDDLGIGFGWMALYFTAFLTIWRGHTPGKRLLRIRVIRLDGKAIGWWAAFERFGGYAAGLVTGLLGFLQIFWDRNRQAIHDKISETVVVRE